MITSRRDQQNGAVLVFTMLLLMMITMLGVLMVQQNRTQFMMAENTQSQATNFSIAENILTSAENYIASQRYETWPMLKPIPEDCYDAITGNPKACSTYNCKNPGGVFQQLRPGDLQGGAVVGVAGSSSIEIIKTVCASSDAVGLQYTNCSLVGQTVCNSVSNVPNPSAPDNISNNPCHTEIYTIRATVVDDALNQREVESNYAIRCDN